MIETCLVFQAGRLPEHPGTAIVTYSGSAKGMMIDYADDAGLDLPAFSDETSTKLGPLLDEDKSPKTRSTSAPPLP